VNKQAGKGSDQSRSAVGDRVPALAKRTLAGLRTWLTVLRWRKVVSEGFVVDLSPAASWPWTPQLQRIRCRRLEPGRPKAGSRASGARRPRCGRRRQSMEARRVETQRGSMHRTRATVPQADAAIAISRASRDSLLPQTIVREDSICPMKSYCLSSCRPDPDQ
jgi:hypothetical protein